MASPSLGDSTNSSSPKQEHHGAAARRRYAGNKSNAVKTNSTRSGDGKVSSVKVARRPWSSMSPDNGLAHAKGILGYGAMLVRSRTSGRAALMLSMQSTRFAGLSTSSRSTFLSFDSCRRYLAWSSKTVTDRHCCGLTSELPTAFSHCIAQNCPT